MAKYQARMYKIGEYKMREGDILSFLVKCRHRRSFWWETFGQVRSTVNPIVVKDTACTYKKNKGRLEKCVVTNVQE